ncbi:MAG: hypothetical protein JW934_15105 [Anaerolineae bacterium]|nr:hypothetical protein [Anaerolineae bacterium]
MSHTPSRKTELEALVRDSHRIIHEYEQTIQTSTRAEEKLHAERQIEAQWANIARYLGEYRPLAGENWPQDIGEIAAHFAPHLSDSQRRQLEQRLDELHPPLDTYNRRIRALQSDIARELDGERRAVLEERRADVERQRAAAQAEMDEIERQLGRR